jgi:hypothetical protein
MKLSTTESVRILRETKDEQIAEFNGIPYPRLKIMSEDYARFIIDAMELGKELENAKIKAFSDSSNIGEDAE